jgi:hypothetical protein
MPMLLMLSPIRQKNSSRLQRSKHVLAQIDESSHAGHIVQKRQRTVPTTEDSAVRSMNVAKPCINIFNIALTSFERECIVAGSPVPVP